MVSEILCPVHGSHPLEKIDFRCVECGCRIWWVFVAMSFAGGEMLCGNCNPPKSVCHSGPKFTETELSNFGIPYEAWVRKNRSKWLQ